METTQSHKTDAHRKLCLKKDLIELSQWLDTIEQINIELDYLKQIQGQLIKNTNLEISLQGFRRNNTLAMGLFCQYEQELRKEFEFGKQSYDATRAKLHENKRDRYSTLLKEFNHLKTQVYVTLSKFKRN